MAALYGHIGEFVETKEEWRQYAERIQHYFAANGVTDALEEACDIPVRHWSEDLQVVKQFGSPEQARREDVRRVGGGSDRASQSCTVRDSAAVQVQLAVPTCRRVGCYLCSGVALDSADV